MSREGETLSPAASEARFRCRARRVINLGPVRVEIRSNELDFRGFRFFSAHEQMLDSDPQAGSNFTLSLCNLKIDAPWPLQSLSALCDRSYRGKKMCAGYYLTDHFGAPAYLITRGRHYWIFAEDFEPILWPYIVKHLLTVYALEHRLLHLKAAGVAIDGSASLLVGRGGSGKTVLLSHLCGAGAQFLSNTHALIDGKTLIGIPTAMRVRHDEFFAPVIVARGLSASVKAGEYVADPVSDLGWHNRPAAPIGSICLLDYKSGRGCTIREIERDTAVEYLEQFALAVNVYGLKEDILDHLGGEISRFSTEMARTKAHLRAVVESARCYYLSCDAANPDNLRAIWGLLAAGR